MKNYSINRLYCALIGLLRSWGKYTLLALVALSLVLGGKINLAAGYSYLSPPQKFVADSSSVPVQAQPDQSHPIDTSTAIISQGNQVTFNGQPYSIPWQQWQSSQSIQTGISDTAAIDLGIELLSTNNPNLQPVVWFSKFDLETRYQPPYRYLNLTRLAAAANWQIETKGNTLHITTASNPIVESILPAADTTKNLSQNTQRYMIELDHPTAWQVSQNPKQAVLTIAATSSAKVQKLFSPPAVELEVDQKLESEILLPPPPVVVESDGDQTTITFNFAIGKGLKVSSIQDSNASNRASLLVDVTPQSLKSKDIAWSNGINWHQRSIKLTSPPSNSNLKQLTPAASSDFPVIWLEVDPALADFELKPVTSTIGSSQGLAPLAITAQQWAATAAINGGFFNRNNQLPLGVVRKDYNWLSGPILDRGAIAWDNLGNLKIARLTLRESLVVGDRSIPLIALNSGYVKGGVSRYTPEWGSTYTGLIDNEIVFVVRNNTIVERIELGTAKQEPADSVNEQPTNSDSESIPIPADGYLLTVRAQPQTADLLAIGAEIELLGQTTPVDWLYYPQIIGAGPLLLQQGQIVVDAILEGFSQAFAEQMADRSAIAINAEGQIFLVAVAHRAGGRGPNLVELAQILQQLGAVDALNLDGGSSASLYLGGSLINRSPDTAAQVHNGIFVFVNSG